MTEWPNVPVLKTGDLARGPRVQISPPPPNVPTTSESSSACETPLATTCRGNGRIQTIHRGFVSEWQPLLLETVASPMDMLSRLGRSLLMGCFRRIPVLDLPEQLSGTPGGPPSVIERRARNGSCAAPPASTRFRGETGQRRPALWPPLQSDRHAVWKPPS